MIKRSPLDAVKVAANGAPAVTVVVPQEPEVREETLVVDRNEPKPMVHEPEAAHGSLPKYVVQNDKITISWGESMLRLRKGTIIGEHSHGPGAVDRMRNAGVALKLLEE